MSPDFVSVVEAAYVGSAAGSSTWLDGVVEACLPLIDDSFGAFGYRYHLEETSVSSGDVVGAGADPAVLEAIRMACTFSSGMRGLHERPRPAMWSVSQLLGVQWTTHGRPIFDAMGAPLGIRDAVALAVVDVGGRGVVLGAPRRSVGRVPRDERNKWSLVAAHLVTALRLEAADALPDPAARIEAVLEPSGRVLHAEGDAREHRDALRDAARSIDRARSSLRRKSPEEALVLWKALVEGEWSLVDQFDGDGRRFVIAKRNAPSPWNAPQPLSEREKTVFALVAQGHAYKWIAYALGLSTATVAKEVTRLARKLGVANRLELLKLANAVIPSPDADSD